MTLEQRLAALHDKRMERIAAGRDAYERIQRSDHYQDWVKTADALVAMREEAADLAGTPNHYQHPRYRTEIKKLEERETWAANINSATKTHCYWLIDNLVAVTGWRETLGQNQRDQWNHPSTIKRNFERLTRVVVPVEPKPTKDTKIAELQEQLDDAAAVAARARVTLHVPDDMEPEPLVQALVQRRSIGWMQRMAAALRQCINDRLAEDTPERHQRFLKLEAARIKRNATIAAKKAAQQAATGDAPMGEAPVTVRRGEGA